MCCLTFFLLRFKGRIRISMVLFSRNWRLSAMGRNGNLLFSSSSFQILDEFCNVKFCIDASQPDVGSWLKYIRFAGSYDQHNLVACQINDQVCFKDFLVLFKNTKVYPWSLKNKNITVSCSRLLWPGCVDLAEATTETQDTELRHF